MFGTEGRDVLPRRAKRLVSSARLHSVEDGKSDLEDSEKRDMDMGDEEG